MWISSQHRLLTFGFVTLSFAVPGVACCELEAIKKSISPEILTLPKSLQQLDT